MGFVWLYSYISTSGQSSYLVVCYIQPVGGSVPAAQRLTPGTLYKTKKHFSSAFYELPLSCFRNVVIPKGADTDE